jgi:Domain of unknown function (DUF4357)
MAAFGKTVRVFLVDGEPGGVVTAEIMNWSGHALNAPRSKLADVLQRPESNRTGVYILIGDVFEIGGLRKIYIGESDNVGKRVSQHSKSDEKEFFERFCFFTSKDANLTKGHVRYLERRLTELARESSRSECINGNDPTAGNLPESDIADMEFFLSQVKIVLPVLGYDILKEPLKKKIENISIEKSSQNTEALELEFASNRDSISAQAYQFEDEIIVKEGSTARKDPQFATNNYTELRNNLIEQKSLVVGSNPTLLYFSKDVPFTSPSAAAAVILGRNANGRTSWVLAGTKKTLKEYQDELTEAVIL